MKVIRIVAIVLGIYVAVGLVLEGAIGYSQPQTGSTAVLRTYDADGQFHDTVLGLLDDGGQLWVESGHWFRGRYHRVVSNPEVELVRGGNAQPRRLLGGPDDAPLGADQARPPGPTEGD